MAEPAVESSGAEGGCLAPPGLGADPVGDDSSADPLAKLEGFWVDIAQPRKQYSISTEWCIVWRGGTPTQQRHHLVVDGTEVHWGIGRSFVLQWKEDDVVAWLGAADGKQKFSWRRMEGGEPAPAANTNWKPKASQSDWKPKAPPVADQKGAVQGKAAPHAQGKGMGKATGKTKWSGGGKGAQAWWDPGASWAAESYPKTSWWSGAVPGGNYGGWNAAQWQGKGDTYDSWQGKGKGQGKWDTYDSWQGKGKGQGKGNTYDSWQGGWDNTWGGSVTAGTGGPSWWQDRQDDSKGKGKGKDKGKAGPWGDASGKSGKGGVDTEGPAAEGPLLESVVRAVGKEDGLTLAFLSKKFAKPFDRFRGGKPGRDDVTFKQWLESTGRFEFKQDNNQAVVCLPTKR